MLYGFLLYLGKIVGILRVSTKTGKLNLALFWCVTVNFVFFISYDLFLLSPWPHSLRDLSPVSHCPVCLYQFRCCVINSRSSISNFKYQGRLFLAHTRVGLLYYPLPHQLSHVYVFKKCQQICSISNMLPLKKKKKKACEIIHIPCNFLFKVYNSVIFSIFHRDVQISLLSNSRTVLIAPERNPYR